MKTYGDFDGFMDKARRVSRYVLPGVAVALTTSCTPEMINALAKTVETPEVSPLPSDFTRTPTPSPTEANYELTPTVVNPATQELTLVSPTEIATEMPIITLTPELTATATQKIEATVVREIPDPEMVEFDRVSLDLNGNSIEFVIGTEEESNAIDILGQVGIEAFLVNKTFPDNQEKFSKLILASFWQNTGQEITFEEYLLKIDNYPIVFRSRQVNRLTFEKSFNVNDIKKIEYRLLTDSDDPRLFFSNFSTTNVPLGFNYFENGTLTIYQLIEDYFINNSNGMIDWGGGKNAIGIKEMLGDQIGYSFPITILSFPHTMAGGSQGNILMDDVGNRMKIVSSLSGYPYLYEGNNYFGFIKEKSFWSVILK